MNRNGNPRLLQYWRDRYRRRRAAFLKRGLTTHGTPRINRKIDATDPTVRRVIVNERAMVRYHRLTDRRNAAGLNAKGQPRKRLNFPRHQHPDFINPLESPYVQRQQAEQRRQHRVAQGRDQQRALRQRNIALGLTSKGTPRKRQRLSQTEHAWRQFRESLAIKTPHQERTVQRRQGMLLDSKSMYAEKL